MENPDTLEVEFAKIGPRSKIGKNIFCSHRKLYPSKKLKTRKCCKHFCTIYAQVSADMNKWRGLVSDMSRKYFVLTSETMPNWNSI